MNKVDDKVMKHVKMRAREWDIPLPDNAEARIACIEERFRKKGILIKFSTFPSLNNGSLGANAGFTHIIFSLEWAAYLVLKNDKTVWNAFLCSIGHELTHRDGNDINPFLHPINIRFIAWANEVHADFESENKMLGQSRSRLIAAMKFKYSQKEQDQDSCSHPSWKRRIHYAENFETFDEKLIRQIAKDARCKNKKLIQEVIDHYTK